MNKEDLTKKYMEFQLLSQQIQQQQQQMQMISQQVNELKGLSDNILEISQAEENSEMYTNLGVGVHIKSQIKDVKNLLVNVGAKIFVKKTPKETIEVIGKQITELEKYVKTVEPSLKIAVDRAERLREDINKAQKEK